MIAGIKQIVIKLIEQVKKKPPAKQVVIKCVEFTLNNETAYINASSLTTMKLWMSTPPFIKVNWNELSPEEKYDILKQTLEESKYDVPMPANPSVSNKKAEGFGFKSWKEFASTGRHCDISLNAETQRLEFMPMIYSPIDKGLNGMKNRAEYISSSESPEMIVNALESLLEKIPALTKDYNEREQESEDDQ